MLSSEYIINNLDEVIKRLNTRNGDYSYLKELKKLDQERKEIIKSSDLIKNKRNTLSKQIGEYKRNKMDTTSLFSEVNGLGDEISKLDEKLAAIDLKIKEILLNTPNLPHASVPVGKDENDNVVIRKWGTPREFDFKVLDHADLAEKHNLLDFKRAAKTSGARFVYNIGLGARLERAIIQLMFDLHIKAGYTEVLPPYLVKDESMYATGQFPKFINDAFKIEGTNLVLNPTAEVPLINYYRDEIVPVGILPQNFVAFSTAFRQEAGSAGKDTKGIIRQHQFNKVELIKFVLPEKSYEELDKMVSDAAKVLETLKLPYQVVALSTGDLGFSMAKTFDIEVYLPSEKRYREISSCSNAEDYQARRANIRFRRDSNSKLEYLHTLNGSGLAVGRTLVAILENYQQSDGSIIIPKALQKYMNGVKVIK